MELSSSRVCRSYLLLMQVLMTSSLTRADYSCLCNYAVESSVMSEPRNDAAVAGYLYEFDCKQFHDVPTPTGWYPIAFEHKVGYLRNATSLTVTTCQGKPPAYDKVTTKAPPTTTTSQSTTTRATTTSLRPTISTTPQRITASSTTRVPLTSPTTSTTSSTTAATTAKATTTTMTTTTTTAAAKTTITTTTTPIPTTPGRLTLHGTHTTQQNIVKGNTRLCPPNLHQYAREDGAALTQYGNSCYELVPIRAIWAKAENDCRAKGGHLFHIQSADFQTFIYNWIKSYRFDHAVWTGLHDLVNEEYFEWITGDHLLYTHWYPDRYGNLASHHIENCVLLVPYAPYFGQWDDVQCGITSFLGDSGQQNPFICEYRIDGSHFPPNILVG